MKKLFIILLFFPILAHAQLANFTPVLVPVTTPTVVAQYTTITGMVATNPNAGTETPDIITFANLTGVITATSTGSVETSVDGGSTFGSSKTFSTGSPYTIELRIPAGTSTGSVTGTVTLTTPGGNTVTISTSGTVSAGATLSLSPTTLTLTSTAGTQGSAQSTTVSGSGLGSNNATVPATPTGYVDSIAGSTWLSSSRTLTPSSGNISTILYYALAAGNAPGSYNSTTSITCAGESLTATLTLDGTTSSSTTVADTTIAQFLLDNTARSITGWTDGPGDPHAGVITATDSRNYQPVSISSVSTAKWVGIGTGNIASSNTLGKQATAPAFSTTGVGISYWYNSINGGSTGGVWNGWVAGSENLVISGLNPTQIYSIQFLSNTTGLSCGTGFSTIYCTDSTNARVDSFVVQVQNNASIIDTFKNKRPDVSGNIRLAVMPMAGGTNSNCGQYGLLNAFIVVKQAKRDGFDDPVSVFLLTGVLIGRLRRRKKPTLR